MQSFTQAGEFTTWGKLRSAMRDNIVYYTSYVVIAIILVVYISLKPGLTLNPLRMALRPKHKNMNLRFYPTI